MSYTKYGIYFNEVSIPNNCEIAGPYRIEHDDSSVPKTKFVDMRQSRFWRVARILRKNRHILVTESGTRTRTPAQLPISSGHLVQESATASSGVHSS